MMCFQIVVRNRLVSLVFDVFLLLQVSRICPRSLLPFVLETWKGVCLGREFWKGFEIVTSITDFKSKVSDFVENSNWGVSEVLVKCEMLQILETVSTCQSVNLSIVVVPFEMLVPTRCPQRAFGNLLWYSSGARAPFPSKHSHDESFDRRRPGLQVVVLKPGNWTICGQRKAIIEIEFVYLYREMVGSLRSNGSILGSFFFLIWRTGRTLMWFLFIYICVYSPPRTGARFHRTA